MRNGKQKTTATDTGWDFVMEDERFKRFFDLFSQVLLPHLCTREILEGQDVLEEVGEPWTVVVVPCSKRTGHDTDYVLGIAELRKGGEDCEPESIIPIAKLMTNAECEGLVPDMKSAPKLTHAWYDVAHEVMTVIQERLEESDEEK